MYCQARFAVIAGLVWIAGKMMKREMKFQMDLGEEKCLVLFSVKKNVDVSKRAGFLGGGEQNSRKKCGPEKMTVRKDESERAEKE